MPNQAEILFILAQNKSKPIGNNMLNFFMVSEIILCDDERFPDLLEWLVWCLSHPSYLRPSS